MLVLGGTYALLGIGLTLIFGIMNVVNFTHGVLYTFGAYMMFIVVNQLGMNFFLALPVAVVAGWALGALIELTLLRPLRGSDIDTTMLVMIGAWIAMQSGALWIWGGVPRMNVSQDCCFGCLTSSRSGAWLKIKPPTFRCVSVISPMRPASRRSTSVRCSASSRSPGSSKSAIGH